MKVLTIVDKLSSAIGRLAFDTAKYLPGVEVRVASLHPKRPDVHELDFIADFQPDIIDVQYWKSGEKLFELMPEYKDIPAVLSHHNPYDLLQSDWKHYRKVILSNSEQKRVLKDSEMVPLAVDPDVFTWQREYTTEKNVMMVVGRIESKKGVLEVAKVCHELGVKFILAGRVSSPEYFDEILKYNPVLAMDCTDSELVDLYHKAALHVCNSIDGFETGTLPILESIACGVPVLTRKIGYIPDIDTEGIMVRDGQPEDTDELKTLISMLLNDRELRLKMREQAYNIIRERNSQRRAIMLYKTWRKALYGSQTTVSVVIPTHDRQDNLVKILEAYKRQTHKNIEIIVVDDKSKESTKNKAICDEFRSHGTVVKYLNTNYDGYGLAKARNMGVMEADGEIIVFNDDRWLPDDDMVEKFVINLKPKQFLCADRRNNKASFVENVSCIHKSDIVAVGMFNEEIGLYGGMTQDIQKRCSHNGIRCFQEPKAKATCLSDSKSRYSKRDEIWRAKNKIWRMWQ